ncbi:MAG TPA: gamma-glutamyltransferase [Bdellovibrionales bacterium]|nr:gamma-glutamyltransferase [Bdellovibrionales bacterium]
MNKQLVAIVAAQLLAVFIFIKDVHAVPFEGHKFLASAPSPYAVETATQIHKVGGNVVDAAVAMSLTLSVTTPYYAALGGGGFALIRSGNGPVEAVDFREVAPAATGPDFYRDKSSQDGGAAVGVPGFPAGLWAMHKKYGRLPWKRLFDDAIRLADQGFQVSGEWVRNTTRNQKRFDANGTKYFFGKEQKPLIPGEILKQPQLGRALRLLRARGEKGFYAGPVAADIAKSVTKSGGVVTVADMAAYKVRWLKPMTAPLKGHTVYMMPPPSSSGVVTKTALGLIEKAELEKHKFLSVDELHMIGEILGRAFRGRALLGDPDFHKNPIDRLTSPEYIAELAKSIDLKKASVLKPASPDELEESSETTHYSVMDAQGNAVALTVTLNGNYGSGVVSEKFGIALNNEMDDFTTKLGEGNMYGLVQGEGNKVEPGKRPLSSMSPTLVEKDGAIVMAAGAPGGPRIISAVLQVVYRTIVNGLDVDTAVQAPRVHHQVLPNVLYVDQNRLSPDVLEALRKRGHTVEESWLAKVYAIKKNAAGWLEGAHDSRGEGATGGY